MTKKIISIISVIALILTMTTIPAFAKETEANILYFKQSDIEQISTEIAESSDYTITVTANGVKTIYIGVDIEKHPEIKSYKVLATTAKKLYEEQKKYVPDGEELTLLTQKHITGELVMHVILYKLLKLTGNDQAGSKYYDAYLQAKYIDLNIDESRVPESLINMTGVFFMVIYGLFSA